MLNYNLKWTTPVKPSIPLGPLTLDFTTGLVLVGKGAVQSGVELQKNMLKILDHFDSIDAPTKPTEGQLWYSRNEAKFKVWDGTQWIITFTSTTSSSTQPAKPQDGELWYDLQTHILYVYSSGWQQIYPSPVASEPIKVAYIDEYNYLATKINAIIGVPAGNSLQFATGYGQTVLPITGVITNADWISLITVAKKIGKKCGVSGTILDSISNNGFIIEGGSNQNSGISFKLQEYSALQSMVEGLFSQRFTLNPTCAETDSPSSGLVSRTSSWSGTINHIVAINFTSNSAMKAYFNTGGAIKVLVNMSAAPSTNVNTEWNSLASSSGTISFSVAGTTASSPIGTTNKGFYDLTSSYQTLFTKSTPGTYTVGNLKVEALQETTSSIKIMITCASSAIVTSDVITSQISLDKPNSATLTNPIIQFPSITKQSSSTW